MNFLFKLMTSLALVSLIFSSCEKEPDPVATCHNEAHAGYTSVTTDDCGDGDNAGRMDGTRLEYKYDATADSIWFLFTVNEITTAQSQGIGLNVMITIPNALANSTFNFWGNDNMNAYHKLVTVWATGTAPSSYTGTIGIANFTGVGAQNYTNLHQNNIDINVNTTDKTLLIGMKRTDLITNSEFPNNTLTVNIAGAVGANDGWNDDIYSSTATMTLTK